MISTDKAVNPTSVKHRSFGTYAQTLGDVSGASLMPEAPWGRCTRGRGHLPGWLACITVDPSQFGVEREAVRLALEAGNIESRPLWKPMHLQPVFAGCECAGRRGG
jgi:pyridoxal phosphate-dependent aminotransferase EpsN